LDKETSSIQFLHLLLHGLSFRRSRSIPTWQLAQLMAWTLAVTAVNLAKKNDEFDRQ
jgi:hypothetical protein